MVSLTVKEGPDTWKTFANISHHTYLFNTLPVTCEPQVTSDNISQSSNDVVSHCIKFTHSWQQKDCLLLFNWFDRNPTNIDTFLHASIHQIIKVKKRPPLCMLLLKMSQHHWFLRSEYTETWNEWLSQIIHKKGVNICISILGCLRPSVPEANCEEINIHRKQYICCTFALVAGVHTWGIPAPC